MKRHKIFYSPIYCQTKQECLTRVKEIQQSLIETELATEEIIRITDEGHTIRFGSSIKNGWVSQSLFGIDIDHLQQIPVKQLIRRLNQYKFPPFAIFTTLGNLDLLNPTRIRIYFALNQEITDKILMQRIIRLLCDIITSLTGEDAVDYQCIDTGHLFFPGHLLYSAPKKKIMVKNIIPLADILYQQNVFLFDRTCFMKELKDSFTSEYGIPGTIFSSLPDIPDPVLLSVTNSIDGRPELKFFELQNSPLVTNLISLSNLSSKNTCSIHYLYPIRGINRYNNIYIYETSNAQKSTEGLLYFAKVKNVYLNLFFSRLLNQLSRYIEFTKLAHIEIKNLAYQFNVFCDFFKIHIETVTKNDLIQNIQTALEFLQSEHVKDYPSLNKIISLENRRHILTAVLFYMVDTMNKWKTEICYRIPQISIAINNHNDLKICHLFNELELFRIVPPKYCKTNHKKKSIINALVFSPIWFDEFYLANAERKAKEFLQSNKTISGLGKVDTKNNKTYLAVENCVISLLDTKSYFTRSMLVKLIETEDICQAGAKGDYIVNRYLPMVASKLKLLKESYTKHISSCLLYPDKNLTYGSSILYFREELLNCHDTDHSIAT